MSKNFRIYLLLTYAKPMQASLRTVFFARPALRGCPGGLHFRCYASKSVSLQPKCNPLQTLAKKSLIVRLKNLPLLLRFSIVVLLAVALVVPGRAYAERATEGIGKWLQEVGVFTGYLTGDLKEQDDLQAIPVGMRFGFDLKPFTKKFGFEPKGLFEIVYEPFISAIFEPESNVEFAFPFFFKYAYPLTEKFYPFVEVGTGPYYMTLGTYEQSTKFNYVSQGGAGLMYFMRKDLALSVEFRYRHVSNGGIKQPNGGINAQVYLVGASYFF